MNAKVNKKIVKGVKKMISDNTKNKQEIADLYDISKSTVYNIVNGKYDYMIQEYYENDNFKIFKSNKRRSILHCGLIYNRHNIPTDLYVFNKSVPKWLMFDYNELDNICRSFILKNIQFNEDGTAFTDVILYVTGLQCALASFIKICQEMHVNLSLAHYNEQYNGYERQIIFNGFGSITNDYPYEINDICNECNTSFTYKCDLQDFKENNILFTVTVTKFIKNKDEIIDKKIILCKSKYDAWDCYKEILNKLENIEENIEILISEYEKSIDGYITFKKKTMVSCTF